MIDKILIANRGEIAVRIIKACGELGIKSVAVYSEADKRALHVKKADETICIGPPPSSESYLNIANIANIIKAAKATESEAIHPGYGFLSENYEFAKKCADEGLIFIGPKWESIKLLGNKIESRKIMSEAGIPIIPGFTIDKINLNEISRKCEELGFPVLIKAAAGGGGKGMKTVHLENELPDAIESVKREAVSSFGDDTIYVEKLIKNPKHIEIQILGDDHGNLIDSHFGPINIRPSSAHFFANS